MKGMQIVKDNRPAGEYELFRALYVAATEIPEGWEINYVGQLEEGQHYLTTGGNVATASSEDEERKFVRLILKKKVVPEKPKTIVIRPKLDKNGKHVCGPVKKGDWYRVNRVSTPEDAIYVAEWAGYTVSDMEYEHYHAPEYREGI